MKSIRSIIKNSGMGLVNQVSNILFTFITRSIFIRYIGVELLGLSSTFASILGTLALAELGIQTAVAYNLYKPVKENNFEEINDILNVLKIVFRVIGIFFIIASIVVLPFLKYIITGIEVNDKIYIYFILQSLTSVCTYFLAYKRTILYATQKEYVTKIVDLAILFLFNVIQCITIIVLQSYSLYLVLKIVQGVASNVIIHIYCNKAFPYLYSSPLNKKIFFRVFGDVKNIFVGRLAGYFYSSTPNLLISAFISTITVGFYTNYTTVTNALKLLTNSILTPIVPIIGNQVQDRNIDKEKLFLLYSHARYILGMMIVVPFIIVMEDFITVWLGSKMILNMGITILLGVDLYIHIVHGSTLDMINAEGLFKADRNVEIIGGISNFLISFVLVQILGLEGVLLGTVISQIILWIGRSYVFYKNSINEYRVQYIKYWCRNMVYLIVFILCVVIVSAISVCINLGNGLFAFIVKGIISESVSLSMVCICFSKLSEQQSFYGLFKR